MSNILNGNTLYIDATSSTTEGTYIRSKDIKVLAIYFTGTLAGDSVTINDLKSFTDAGTPAAGALKIKVTSDAANKPVLLELGEMPLRFPNGIWISALSASSTATLVIDKVS